jgi:CRP-like cAMP-binding protein
VFRPPAPYAMNSIDVLRPFLTYLRQFDGLSEEEFLQIAKYTHVKRYGKKEMILEKGEVEDHLHFILKGLVRKFYIKYKEEFNTQISYEGHIIHSQESFHSRKPSEYYIETIEPTVLASISHHDLERLYSSSRKLEHIARLVITHTMVLKDRWKMQLVEILPKDRFIKFVNDHPELLQRVPQKYLASYLNIKPETFSRFKHLTLRKRKIST